MSYKDKLDKCLVSLDVGDHNALFIVLAKDGTICRKGNGNPAANLEMLKGASDLQHYEAYMMTINEDWFQFSGAFEQTPIVGRVCKMLVVFSGPDGEEAGFKVNYGEDSQGPPKEIAEMVINAVKLTEGWYQGERDKLKVQPQPIISAVPQEVPEAESRKWWEFWK
jgi:hypothetical protein